MEKGLEGQYSKSPPCSTRKNSVGTVWAHDFSQAFSVLEGRGHSDKVFQKASEYLFSVVADLGTRKESMNGCKSLIVKGNGAPDRI